MNRFLIALLLLPTLSFAQTKMVKRDITDEVSLKIPSSFITMTSSERVKKYVSSREPLAVFTSEDRYADLGVNQNPMQWKKEDTEMIYGFYKASINSLFDNIEFIQDTVREVNGREFIIFEFVSTLKEDNVFKSESGQKHYTYIQYTSYNDQVLLFNFGCQGKFQSRWQSIAGEIMESVRVK